MTQQTLFTGPLRRTSVNAPSTGVEIWTPHWRLIDYREAVLSKMVGPFVGGPFGIANAIEQSRIFGN